MHSGKKVTTFKERFSDLVSESSFSDGEISRGLKVSKQTISAWKIGTRSPKEPTIITIAQFFHVNVEWLMGFDVEKFSQSFTDPVFDKRAKLIRIIQQVPEDKIDLLSSIIQSILEDARKGS